MSEERRDAPEASSEQRLFLECLSLPVGERRRLLDERCAGDPKLRARLEGMLELHIRHGDDAFLESPVLRLAGPVGRPDLWIGRRISEFTVRSVLGVGGTSVVFEVERDGEPDRPVALKLLLQTASASEERRLFSRECRILEELDHPLIDQLIETGTSEEGLSFLVMEKIDGAQALIDEMTIVR